MTLAPYLRGPALALACLALACVLCAAAAWAQAPDLAPALPTGPAPAADPFAGIAAAWGPSGASLLAVAAIWKEWRKDVAAQAKKIEEQQALLAALDKQVALTQQSVHIASEALRRAVDT
jgi:hypothetical protein